MDKNCIFCKIVSGEISAQKVYETDKVLAFLDISPINLGHTLVVPKNHSVDMSEVSDQDLSDTMVVVKKVGQAVLDGLGYQGYNIGQNNGPVAGQVVMHLHFHVIPRNPDDGLKLWPQKDYQAGQADEVAEKIKQAIK